MQVGEQDLAGILAREKLAERDRLEYTQKIEAISKEVAGVRKNFDEGMKKVAEQVKAVATSRGDSEVLKKWDGMSQTEKELSPLIPRNAYQTQLEAILEDEGNIPGLKRRVAELMDAKDIEEFLTEDPTGEKIAEAICTSESCRTKVKEKVHTFQKEHGLKKEGLFD